MLIEFSVGNFYSFKDIQTISLNAANIVSKYPFVDQNNVFNHKGLKLLKSKAIYGANASGKSNLSRAFVSFVSIINESVKNDGLLEFRIFPFELSTETDSKPSFFQMVFSVNNVIYRYGFEADRSKIHSEWLYGTPNKREVYFFRRKGKKIEINSNQFLEGHKIEQLLGKDSDVARPNSLFLTTVATLNGKLAKSIVDYLSGLVVITGLMDFELRRFAETALQNDKVRARIAKMLKNADIGLEDINVLEINQDNLGDDAPEALMKKVRGGKKHNIVITDHMKYDKSGKKLGTFPMSLDIHESEGTKKMFEISPVLMDVLNNGKVLVFDEFDARLHPLLTRKIVEMFNSKRTNKKNAQIIFATHDTNLLSAKLLRRDQISFVEKDKYGASHLYSLVDFKGVRNDSSFEKDYIQGKFGAIPFLGNLEEVFG
ncbi:ATP-binding protein [Paracrocinitomix mangrovi]|uniref:AAA family ATPase n=1 Tax=Paracrocinitomix mangrovi TaxID=2862509 RepID=UPI001C8F1D08|nr:ATP-binding protein [Paracrocinitomix mangrovi]UKN03807.1 ATP-binding protein [Paracrocinitomix mangrovi]